MWVPPWGLWPQAVASSFATTKNIKTKVALMLKMTFSNKKVVYHVHIYIYMVDSHESDAFGPYFEKVHFLNIQNKQRLYITHSEARHLHLINSQHFFVFVNLIFFNSYFLKI